MEGEVSSNPVFSLIKLSKTSGNSMQDPQLYLIVVVALQYTMLTCPNLSFIVNEVCQFIQMPTDDNWQSVNTTLYQVNFIIWSSLLKIILICYLCLL